MQERVMQVNAAVARLSRDLGRSPSAQEVAASLEAAPEEVLEAMEAAMAYDAVSLEGARGPDSDEGDSYAETIGEEDAGFELVDYRDAAAAALKTLPRREQLVLRLRFFGELTQSEIGQRIGVSQMHVSRLKRRALAHLQALEEERAA
jgi:RNA polymerase sigma-B factor